VKWREVKIDERAARNDMSSRRWKAFSLTH